MSATSIFPAFWLHILVSVSPFAESLNLGRRNVWTRVEQPDKSLIELAQQHANKDNMIVLTFVDSGFKEVFLNWAATMAKYDLDQHVVVIALDDEMYSFLSDHDFATGRLVLPKRPDGVTQHNLLWPARMKIVSSILQEAKVDVVMSDADAMWLRADVLEYIKQQPGDIVASRGTFPFEWGRKWGATVCMGFVVLRTSISKQSLTMLEDQTNTSGDDQVGINQMLALSNIKWERFNTTNSKQTLPLEYAFSNKIDMGTYDASDGMNGVISLLPNSDFARDCENGLGPDPYVMHCHLINDDTGSGKEEIIKRYHLTILRDDWQSKTFRGDRNAWLKEISE